MPPRSKQQELHRCVRCDFSTPSLLELAEHSSICETVQDESAAGTGGGTKRNRSSLKIVWYTCNRCDWMTKESREFLRHRLTVHGEKVAVFECSQCSFAADSEESLRTHRDRWHPAPSYSLDDSPSAAAGGGAESSSDSDFVSLSGHASAKGSSKARKSVASEDGRKSRSMSQDSTMSDVSEAYGGTTLAAEDEAACSDVHVDMPGEKVQMITSKLVKGLMVFRCEDCGYKSSTIKAIYSHRRMHKYRCKACPFSSFSRKKLSMHCAQVHRISYVESATSFSNVDDGIIRVELVEDADDDDDDDGDERKSTISSSLDDSISSADGRLAAGSLSKGYGYTKSSDGIFHCADCLYSSASYKNVRKHYRHHVGSGPAKCHLCSFRASTNNRLQTHIKDHHHHHTTTPVKKQNSDRPTPPTAEDWQLEKLWKRGDARTSPMKGKRMKDESKIFGRDKSLDILPAVEEATAAAPMVSSKSSASGGVVKRARCCFCQKKCVSQSALIAHCGVSHPSCVYFTCHVCGMIFTSAGGVKRHSKRLHEGSAVSAAGTLLDVKAAGEVSVVKSESIDPDRIDVDEMYSTSGVNLCSAATKLDDEFCTVVNVEEGTVTTIRNDFAHHYARSNSSSEGSQSSEAASQDLAVHRCPCCEFTARKLSVLERHAMLHADAKLYTCLYCPFNSVWKYCIEAHIERSHAVELARGDSSLKKLVSLCYQPGTKTPGVVGGTGLSAGGKCVGEEDEGETADVKLKAKKGLSGITIEGSVGKHKKLCVQKADVVLMADGRNKGDGPHGKHASGVLTVSKSTSATQISSSKSGTSEEGHAVVASKSLPSLLSCSKCPYKAKNVAMLANHEEAHENLRRYLCDQCGFRANAQHNMKWHTMSVHKGKTVQIRILSRLKAKSTLAAYLALRNTTTNKPSASVELHRANSNTDKKPAALVLPKIVPKNSSGAALNDSSVGSTSLKRSRSSSVETECSSVARKVAKKVVKKVAKIVIRKVTRGAKSPVEGHNKEPESPLGCPKKLITPGSPLDGKPAGRSVQSPSGKNKASSVKLTQAESDAEVDSSAVAKLRSEIEFMQKAGTSMKKEAKIIYVGGIKIWMCMQCKFRTKNRSKFVPHLAAHRKLYLFACRYCDYRSNYDYTMRAHILKVHNKTNEGMVSLSVEEAAKLPSSQNSLPCGFVKKPEVAPDSPRSSRGSDCFGRPGKKRSLESTSEHSISLGFTGSPAKPRRSVGSPKSDMSRVSTSSSEFRTKRKTDGKTAYDDTGALQKCVLQRKTEKISRGKYRKITGLFKAFKCSFCGFRSNWKHCVYRHISMNHPTLKATVIQLSLARAKQTIQKYETSFVASQSRDDEQVKKHPNAEVKQVDGDAKQSMKNVLPPVGGERGLRRLKCSECDARFEWRRAIRRHIKARHPSAVVVTLSLGAAMKLYSCEEPSVAALPATPSRGKTGKDSEKNPQRFSCESCSFRSNLCTAVIEHIKTVHGSSDKPTGVLDLSTGDEPGCSLTPVKSAVSTPKCGTSSPARQRSGAREEAQRTGNSSAEKKGKKIVGRSLSLKKKRAASILTSAMKKGSTTKCSICPFNAFSARKLRVHMKMHTRRPGCDFECDKCPYYTVKNFYLQRHMEIHKSLGTVCKTGQDIKALSRDSASSTSSDAHKGKQRKVAQKSCSTPNSSPSKLSVQSSPRVTVPLATNHFLPLLKKDVVGSVEPATVGEPVSYCLSEVHDGRDGDRTVEVKQMARKTGGKTGFQARRSLAGSCVSRSSNNTTASSRAEDVGSQRWGCEKCSYVTRRTKAFRAHVSLHGSKQRYECEYCDYSVSTFHSLLVHRKGHLVPNPNLLYKNLLTVTNPGNLLTNAVDDDDRVVFDDETLEEHRADFAPPGRLLRCERCPFSCTEYRTFVVHFQHHVERRAHVCAFCDFSAAAVSVVSDHAVVHFNLPGCELNAKPLIDRYTPEVRRVVDEIDAICRNNRLALAGSDAIIAPAIGANNHSVNAASSEMNLSVVKLEVEDISDDEFDRNEIARFDAGASDAKDTRATSSSSSVSDDSDDDSWTSSSGSSEAVDNSVVDSNISYTVDDADMAAVREEEYSCRIAAGLGREDARVGDVARNTCTANRGPSNIVTATCGPNGIVSASSATNSIVAADSEPSSSVVAAVSSQPSCVTAVNQRDIHSTGMKETNSSCETAVDQNSSCKTDADQNNSVVIVDQGNSNTVDLPNQIAPLNATVDRALLSGSVSDETTLKVPAIESDTTNTVRETSACSSDAVGDKLSTEIGLSPVSESAAAESRMELNCLSEDVTNSSERRTDGSTSSLDCLAKNALRLKSPDNVRKLDGVKKDEALSSTGVFLHDDTDIEDAIGNYCATLTTANIGDDLSDGKDVQQGVKKVDESCIADAESQVQDSQVQDSQVQDSCTMDRVRCDEVSASCMQGATSACRDTRALAQSATCAPAQTATLAAGDKPLSLRDSGAFSDDHTLHITLPPSRAASVNGTALDTSTPSDTVFVSGIEQQHTGIAGSAVPDSCSVLLNSTNIVCSTAAVSCTLHSISGSPQDVNAVPETRASIGISTGTELTTTREIIAGRQQSTTQEMDAAEEVNTSAEISLSEVTDNISAISTAEVSGVGHMIGILPVNNVVYLDSMDANGTLPTNSTVSLNSTFTDSDMFDSSVNVSTPSTDTNAEADE